MIKKVFISLGILLPLCALLIWNGTGSDRESPPSTEEKVVQAIIATNPAFLQDSEPVIEATSISRHEDRWITATIYSSRDTQRQVPVRVALLENDSKMRVIAGPDTYFPEAEMLSRNLPDSVILELQR